MHSDVANFYETTLAATMAPTDLTMVVATTANVVSPAFLVVEPDVISRREVILFDGTFTASNFVTLTGTNRYLAGSAAAGDITHPIGSVVRSVPLEQHHEEVHARIDQSPSSLDELTDVDASAPTDGQVLSFRDADDKWTPKNLSVLDDLADVSTSGVARGTVLANDGSQWIPMAGIVPVGALLMWAATNAPAGNVWLLCQGQTVLRADYPELYAVVGDLYGANDGTTNFLLPDLRSRFPIGASGPLAGPSLGVMGGTWSHTHNGRAHSHSTPNSGVLTTTTNTGGHTHTVPDIGNSGGHTHVVPTTGSGGSHDHASTTVAAQGGSGGKTYGDGGTLTNHSHTVNTTSSSHTHGIPDATTSGSGHTHTVANTTTTGSGHEHNTPNHNHGDTGDGSSQGSTDATSASNPPYATVNFIIKARLA